ncbi:hypothetical protein HRG_004131 [Hirsutella rhossiliensis]|uniref:Uncharacterized protein n=1 Tax=Hirsutella rhossiliensis TaxID=111463 RepID=A0A9P8N3F2_9HYPO|nr:uncharacterized protein HRG_04131 [Hirsutella rhossiliensis]KAH0966115.1 hypothetical protein HRG_04131 [Hirsutella rhossiliensis]
MARWHFLAWPDLAWATVRGLGWLAALGALLIMSFTVHRWPDTECRVVAPGFAGAAAALLVDSWQAIALGGQIGFPPLTRRNVASADFATLVFSLAGGFIILFKKILVPETRGYDGAVIAANLRLSRHRQLACGDMLRAAVCALAVIRWVQVYRELRFGVPF